MIILQESLYDFSLKDLEPIISKYKEFYFSFIDKYGFVNYEFLMKVYESINGNFDKILKKQKVKKFIFYKSSTKRLNSKSNSIKTANTVNSIPIYIGTSFGYDTSYIFNEQIFLSISLEELTSLIDCYKYKKSVFKNEKTKTFVKNLENCEHNVSHEISHWIDHSITNFVKPKFYNIKKIAEINDVNFELLMQYPNFISLSSYFEINAQIHTIKTLKEKYIKDWDNFSIHDIISKSPSLEIVFQILSNLSLKYANNWIKHLLKRMYREKLLGKKMMENKSMSFGMYRKKYIDENLEISKNDLLNSLRFLEILKP